ncbi:glycosyltransferase family 4 protein [Methylosinus sp. Sm6]|uniref:glycosyltransferase family 4 protein n=1 Tax=Methylosinus sp. Sm6 TaxID=2866948 RepID=UPI001C9923D0|nr:glycosyltransferase family 4 protein [Methylosinus sp. Sm6]MBY6241347.1 glycosyltransferase family 4 protein [Methylosinus sp. Sm6]
MSDAMRNKLLIVTDDANMGGTYRVAEQLVAGMAASFDIRFACSFEAKNAASRKKIEASGVTVLDYRVCERNPQRAAFALEDAQRLLDAVDPDVILLVDGGEIWSLLALKQVAAARGIPYVVSVNLLTEDCVRRFAELRGKAIETLRAAHAIVFVSEASRRRFETLLPAIDAPKHVVANSRPGSYFDMLGTRQATRRSLGLRDDETLMLCAARIEPRKGQTLCLEAFEQLRAHGRLTKLRLAFAGGGVSGDVDALHRAIADKGLGEHVLALGPRDDVPSLLEACDAFVLPSYSEGMPLSIIEAMAKGRAVIATAVDGVPEQIDRMSGILAPSPVVSREDCVAALADAMALLRDDPRLRERMGRCARLRAVELFDERRMIGEYGAVVALAASHRRPQRRFEGLRAHPLRRAAANEQEREALRGSAPSMVRIGSWMDAGMRRRLARERAVRADLRAGLAPGSLVELHDPAQCWSCASDGWDVVEDAGVWNDGAISTIRLRLRRPMRRLRVRLDLMPFAPPGRRQETDVLADGALVAGWSFDAHVWESRTIDIHRRTGSRTLELRFVYKTVCSPRAVGLSDDARDLAIFLRRIEIQRVPLRERLRETLRFDARALVSWQGAARVPAE